MLTSDSRDNWFRAYQLLKKNGNSKAIETIENGLFLLCLDDDIIGNEDVLTKTGLNSLHGLGTSMNGSNRWYDKALQFIIAKSGEVAISNEHSFAEAVPTMAIADHILDQIQNGSDISNSYHSTTIEHIPFALNSEIMELIDKSSENLNKYSTFLYSIKKIAYLSIVVQGGQ